MPHIPVAPHLPGITGLLAAAFCMFNRYVDGLATWAPDDPAFYRHRGAKVAELGYRSEPTGYMPGV